MNNPAWILSPLDRSLGSYRDTWDALNRARFGDHPLLSATFIEQLLDKFGSGREYLCRLQQDGRTKAMCIIKPRSCLVWESFLPSQAQIAPSLVANQADLLSLPGALPASVMQLDMLCNDPLLTRSNPGTHHALHVLNHALTMSVSLSNSFEQYWGSRSKNLRANIKRYERRVRARDLQVRLQILCDRADIGPAIERYATIELAGWKGRQGTALPSSPEQLAFYKDLFAIEAQHANAVVYELYFNDRLAASRLVIHRHGMLVILKTTYDESLSAYAPGRLLLYRLLAHEFEQRRFRVIEFYTDATQDQLAWSTDRRWIQHLSLYHHPFLGGLLNGLRAIRRQSTVAGDAHAPAETGKVYNSLAELPADARALLDSASSEGSYLGSVWFENLADTLYRQGAELRFAVLECKGAALAVLPLRVDCTTAACHLRAMSNLYTPLYQPGMNTRLKPRQLLPLLHALRHEVPRLASLTFEPMAPESHAYQSLVAGLRLAGFPAFEFYCFGNWYYRRRHDWPGYLASRPGDLRTMLNCMGKKFQADGGRFQLYKTADEVEAGIAAYEQVYAVSWKRPGSCPSFMPGLMRRFAVPGQLRLGIAWLGERPVAAQVWIVAARRAEIHKLVCDEAFRHYAPSSLLTAFLMHQVLEEDQVQEVDYLFGDDDYKQVWMDQRRERWGIIAYNPTSVAGCAGLVRHLLGRKACMLKIHCLGIL